MKCSVSKEVLSAHLQKVCNIVSRRPVLPILNNVRLEAKENILNLKATDLEITIRTELRADVEYSGETTLPAKSLLALVSKLKGDKIEIDCGDNHHAAIKCGSAEFLLKGLDPVDFPDDPLFESKRKIRLTQPKLGRMIDYVSYAVCQDSSRKTLQGILFSVKGSILTTVATDGKRLAFVEKEVEESSGDGDIILLSRTALELRRLLGEEGTVELEISERHIRVRFSDTLLYSKLVEGSYPNFRQIIPGSFQKMLDIPRDAVMQTLDLLAVPLTADISNLKLTFKRGELEFFSRNDTVGEGKDRLEVAYDYDDPLEITFNYQLLQAPFRYVREDQFRLQMNGASSPVMIEDGKGFHYVLMPLRVK